MQTNQPELTSARSGLQAVVPLYLDQVAVDERGFITQWRVAFLPDDVDPDDIARALKESINLDEPHRCRVFDTSDRYLAGHPGTPPAARPRALTAFTRLVRRTALLLRSDGYASEQEPAIEGASRHGGLVALHDLLAHRPASEARGQMMVAGRVRVEWSELGEGWDGDFDPADPEDVELLRFDFSALLNGRWVTVKDASFCTQVPVSTDPATRQRLLAILLLDGAPTIEAGLDQLLTRHESEHAAAAAESEVIPAGRRVFEELSWIAPEWA